MLERIKHRRLMDALLEEFDNMGLQVTHVVGSTKYENPNWVQLGDSWAMPDIMANDRRRGLIIFGLVGTEDSWDSEAEQNNIEVLRVNAHRLYIIVPNAVINSARLEQHKKRWENVRYISSSNKVVSN